VADPCPRDLRIPWQIMRCQDRGAQSERRMGLILESEVVLQSYFAGGLGPETLTDPLAREIAVCNDLNQRTGRLGGA
jgi:hypothetical protein